MNDQHTPLCGSVPDELPCILTEDHDGMYHEDTNGYRWPTAATMRQAAEDLRPAGLDALLDYVSANFPDEPGEKNAAHPVSAGHDTKPAPAEASADFYQPGHTYTSSTLSQHGWKFRCDAVTTHPEDGERTAIGWRFFCGEWEVYDYREDDWDVQNFGEASLVDEGGAR